MDLVPFVERSESIELTDHEGKILELCTYDNKLAAIPFSYTLTTLIADSDIMRCREGGTITQFLEAYDAQKNPALIEGLDRRYIMYE